MRSFLSTPNRQIKQAVKGFNCLIAMLFITTIYKGQVSTNTLSSVNIIGSVRIDSVIVGKDTIVVQKDIRVEGDLKVKGDTKVKGNLKIDGKIRFDNATGISYLSSAPTSTSQGQYFFGKQSNSLLPFVIPCNSSTLTEGADPKFNFSGMLNSYSQGSNIDASMHVGMAGWGNGIIEVGGLYNGQPSPGLLMNYFCGRDIYMCTGSNGGTVFLGKKVAAAANLRIGYDLSPIDPVTALSIFHTGPNGPTDGIKLYTGAATSKVFSIGNFNFSTSPFTIFGNGYTQIGSSASSTPYRQLTVNGDVSFANYGTNATNGFNGIEILGNNQIPTRRGISTDADPNGNFNFYIHDFQAGAAFNFKNGNGNKDLFRIMGDGRTEIYISNAASKMFVIKDPTLAVNLQEKFIIYGNGNTYIGDQRPKVTGPHADAKLAVDGKILAKSIYVNISNTVWPDYVFEKNYKLMSLKDVEAFINANKFLPNLPSAKDLTAKDDFNLSLSDMQRLQMEKIEELFLYLINQEKEIEKLKKRNFELEEKMKNF